MGDGTGVMAVLFLCLVFFVGSCTGRLDAKEDCEKMGHTVILGVPYKCERMK